MKGLTISQVAREANVNIETIRYYERRGLISEPPRTESGYRKFPQEVVNDIKFIKRTQDLGFTLEEIKSLLSASMMKNFVQRKYTILQQVKLKRLKQKFMIYTKLKHYLRT
ncbi:MAG: MerR family transcriptional regulator [Bacillaceae bacterium]|nr:MerR family transcriptional regulator [Bacillaceae bacterium]